MTLRSTLVTVAIVFFVAAVVPATALPFPPAFAQVASPTASSLPATPAAAPLPAARELGITFPVGIDVTVLAATSIDAVGTSSLLRLERVTVPEGTELDPRTPAGPELLYGELGTAMLNDASGPIAVLAPSQQAALVPGSTYTVRNTGTFPASVLRLSLGDPSVPPDTASQVLLEAALPVPPPAPLTMLVALASWQPGADTGTFTTAGAVGVFINVGTLTVTGPSGLQAAVTPGQGLVFPAGVPQRERNTGTEPVVALLVAIAPITQPLVASVPAPTPIPASPPESTPLPTPPANPAVAELATLLEQHRSYGDACDAEGRASLFAIPFLSFAREEGASEYEEDVYEDRDELVENFLCEIDLERSERVYDQLVIRPQGNRATVSFRYRILLHFATFCRETMGRSTIEVERQASGEWRIVKQINDYQPARTASCR